VKVPTRRDVTLALAAAVIVTAGFASPAIGASRSAEAAPVTFSKDIAPVVFAKCAMCHHPGGSAPFSVMTYDSARRHATQMAEATRNGFMPPWKADPAFGGEFVGQSHLTAAEIDRFAQWAAAGAPEGDPGDMPAPPAFTEGWQIGTPDLVVSPPAYDLPPEGTDVFRIFVVPLPVTALKYVRAVEFRPGNPRVVHHANIRIDSTPASRRFDDADPAPGYEGLIAHSAVYPDGHFLGWTPGQVSPLLPKGLAWRLNPGTDLVVEIHMQPNGRHEEVQPSIGLYFGSDPPERTPVMLRLGRQSIDIPAGDAHYTIGDSYVLPVDVEVEAVQPHAHYRATRVTGIATLPDGTVRPLIRITDWDFRWQHVYRYVEPFTLPKGTTLSMEYVYDNSAENPRNPVLPPRRVYWGQRSADEMGDLWIQVLTKNDRDLALLSEEFGRKVTAEDVIGYERWIQSEPTSAALHDDVATLYLRLNRPDAAVRHFAISAGLKPSAQASFNLGTALTLAGETRAAVEQYEHALVLRPDYAQAHTNLGSVLLQQGQTALALEHLDAALGIDPASVQAHYSAGIANEQLGRIEPAIDHFRRALHLRPDFPQAQSSLAWLLAVAGDARLRDPAQAVSLAERAAALTGRRDAAALDALAAAYASAGIYDRAVATATEALALGPPNAAEITARRELYRAETPYRLAAR
jgi:tetratricopeptide (TPR) repeat protein